MSESNHQTESSKSNYIITLLLLVVSVIVIISTFNSADNDKNLTVQTNMQADSASVQQNDAIDNQLALTETKSAEENQKNSEQLGQLDQEIPAEAILVSKVEETDAVTQTAVVEDANTIKSADVSTQQVKNIAQANTEETVSDAKPTNTEVQQELVATQEAPQYSQQQRQYNYNVGVAHAQEQARKHYTMMQQRRYTYEQDMLSRRQHYDAARKKRRNKNTEMFNAQKALFQNAQQNRLAVKQKIQDIHNKISALHEELHQLMRDPQSMHGTSGNTGYDQQLEVTSEKI